MFAPDITIGQRSDKVIIRRRSLADYMLTMEASLNRDRKYSSKKSGEWSGTNTLVEYRDMLRDGWQHGVTGVEGLDGLASDNSERLMFVRNVGGAFPVVPAHLAGHPASMLAPTMQASEQQRGLTLVIDACFNAGVGADTVLEYARKVMRMVAWLAAERIDVAVYVIVPIRMNSKRVLYITPIREAGDALQPERVAAILHPSWLRRAWFSMIEYQWLEGNPAKAKRHPFSECRACEGSYGQVTHATADELRTAIPEAYSVILLPKIGHSCPADAIKNAVNLKLRIGD